MKTHSLFGRLFIAALAAALVIPVINTAVIGSIYTYCYSTVTIAEIVSDVLGYFSGFIGVFGVFASFACVMYAVLTRQLVLPVCLVVGISIPLMYVVTGIVDAAFYGSRIINAAYVLYSALNCGFELLRFGALLLAAVLLARHVEKKKRPHELELFSMTGALSCAAIVTTVVTALAMLVANATETVTLLLEYGGPVNTSETLTLVLPYVTTAIYTILGYFLVYILMRFFEGGHAKKAD